ncbi:malate synthase G [Corynebacterium sanguinis]|uniref:Malate synthase G n=1 Tax=Corynebacterium sanguinis TaxID=2594913 RepID=A0A6C1TYF9_9CORY|nr:malate synthase G [Corynebacterium sanguinis]MCT1426169.1 malate synthase G [Corynebacterium sanguinis]MCT1628581.1 malate synthase G [Corynebacterium sanguinis]TVS28169.1 malate synthase G [Corynebacterium sanguinis]
MTTPTFSAHEDRTERVEVAGLQVAKPLHDFVNNSLLPEIGMDADTFWAETARYFADLTPKNKALLERRDDLQRQLDEYYRANPGQPDPKQHEQFLREIGYLVDQPRETQIRTENVDPEFAEVAGPQLVVPITNPRFAINAANARFGSLYDALYGTDVISEDGGAEPGKGYNPVRGDKVIAWARDFLDKAVPLDGASHADVEKYSVSGGSFSATVDGRAVALAAPEVYVGFQGDVENPEAIVLRNNGLHILIQIDSEHPVGKGDKAHVKDVVLEAAVSSIMDFEDSSAAVDGSDKAAAYATWFGLNKGDISETVAKGDKSFERTQEDDLFYTSKDGEEVRLHGRAMMLCRNVGHLMTTPAILVDGEEVPEGLLDGIITVASAIPGLREDNPHRNSRTGSMYIVKPKQHGPEEVAFTNEIFDRVEQILGLPRFTVKVGVMDEERRTSVNLDACINAAADRLVFINTGFLDRTGDEIHTSMYAGPFVRKAGLQTAAWKQAYENNNVDAGIEHGLPGRAQIGKGMWAETEHMAAMVEKKIGQPKEGANTAWVPSPTGATLHATHYHQVDVFDVQEELRAAGRRDSLRYILTVPVAEGDNWSDEEKREELDNNCQSILGYVVRWVEQGVGCSKVPDIHNVDLMEDRATLRISSQILANWLVHGVVTEDQVIESLERMAKVVDEQNAGDANYLPMAADFDQSVGFQAAKDLILKGTESPSGYTEPILHAKRREFKAIHGIA